ncbi:hypothetical protein PGQ11_010029 [Apiospora arundinis]|uniref:Uncharacterized protein n=1 Tax=Apiospora arundinis TaxID=335852 RepID=A0ABR2I9F7_9PEZI
MATDATVFVLESRTFRLGSVLPDDPDSGHDEFVCTRPDNFNKDVCPPTSLAVMAITYARHRAERATDIHRYSQNEEKLIEMRGILRHSTPTPVRLSDPAIELEDITQRRVLGIAVAGQNERTAHSSGPITALSSVTSAKVAKSSHSDSTAFVPNPEAAPAAEVAPASRQGLHHQSIFLGSIKKPIGYRMN